MDKDEILKRNEKLPYGRIKDIIHTMSSIRMIRELFLFLK